MADFTKEDLAKFMALMRLQQQAEDLNKQTTREIPEPGTKATPHQTDADDRQNLDIKSDFLIEERLYCLASRAKFLEAISVSEELESIDKADIGIKLLIAECYIQLGRENKAEKTIKDIEKILTKQPICNAEDVINLAKDFSNNSNHIRALVLLRIASDMFYNDPLLSPNDKVGKVFRCLDKMDDVIDEMVKPRDTTEEVQNIMAIQQALAIEGNTEIDTSEMLQNLKKNSEISERTRVLSLDYGVEVMDEILEKIISIEDVDPEMKTLKIASAANIINSHYTEPSQFQKAIKWLIYGIKLFENQFGNTAEQYSVYGIMLGNIGVDYHNAERYKEAEKFKVRCIEAVEFALDFDSEKKKQENLKNARESLRITRSLSKLA